MLIEFFKKLESSKWYSWGPKALIVILLLIHFQDSELQQGLEIIVLFALPFAGMLLGKYSAPIINTHILKRSKEFGSHLSVGLSAFGFLFMPVIIGKWTNKLLITNFNFYSMEAHFLWACMAGMIFFAVSHSSSES